MANNATLLSLPELDHLQRLHDLLINYCTENRIGRESAEKILCVLFCTLAIANQKTIEQTLRQIQFEFETGVESYAKFGKGHQA